MGKPEFETVEESVLDLPTLGDSVGFEEEGRGAVSVVDSVGVVLAVILGASPGASGGTGGEDALGRLLGGDVIVFWFLWY